MPTFPRRMNLVEIEIQQLNTTRTRVNDRWRQKTKVETRSAAITVKGQPNFGKKALRASSRTRIGDEETIDAWIVFRIEDLDAEGVTLRKGDLVTKVAGRPMQAEITELRPESALRGRFLLLYAMLAMDTNQRGGVR